jgi:hypothetical protein
VGKELEKLLLADTEMSRPFLSELAFRGARAAFRDAWRELRLSPADAGVDDVGFL